MTKVSKKAQHRLEVLKNNTVVLKLWKHYKNFYRKEYQTTEEENERVTKFTNNLKIIIKENARFHEGVKSFKLHLNQFGDMDLSEFRQKMTGLQSNGPVYIKSFLMQRRKRFLFDSVKKKIKKVKDKIKKKLHPGKNQTNDSDTFIVTDQPVTRNNQITRRSTTTVTSLSMVDYRPYMNPIENQGQCG
jgi:predicted nucleotidyltransferase